MDWYFLRYLVDPLSHFYTLFKTNNPSVSFQLLLPKKKLIIIWHCAPLALLIDTCDSRISHDDSRFGKNRSSFVAKSQTYRLKAAVFVQFSHPFLWSFDDNLLKSELSILHNMFSAKFIVVVVILMHHTFTIWLRNKKKFQSTSRPHFCGFL